MSRRAPKPRKSRAETKRATHDALIEAGIAEIAEGGLEVSLDAICARAELTRGAFYVHFEDRDAFLVAVMKRVLGGFVAQLTARPPTDSVADAIRAFFAAARDRSPLVYGGTGLRFHHVLEACRRSQQIGDTYRSVVVLGREQLVANLRRDQRSGAARDDIAPEALADFLVIAALGVTTSFELGLPLDIARLADSMIELLGGPPSN